MGTQNGSTRFEAARHAVDERYDALKSGVQHIVERVLNEPDGSPTQVRALWAKAGEVIKTHPYAAIGVALGAGFLIGRMLRR